MIAEAVRVDLVGSELVPACSLCNSTRANRGRSFQGQHHQPNYPELQNYRPGTVTIDARSQSALLNGKLHA